MKLSLRTQVREAMHLRLGSDGCNEHNTQCRLHFFGLLGAPEMGAAGAALATAISYGLDSSPAYCFSLKPKAVRLRLKYIIHTDMEFRRSFSKYSTPYLLNQLLWGFGFTMISVILGHMGSDAVAANAIVAVVKDLVSCFCYALGSGGTIVVGNELEQED